MIRVDIAAKNKQTVASYETSDERGGERETHTESCGLCVCVSVYGVITFPLRFWDQ